MIQQDQDGPRDINRVVNGITAQGDQLSIGQRRKKRWAGEGRGSGTPGRKTAWGEHSLFSAEAANTCGDSGPGHHKGLNLQGKAFGFYRLEDGNHAGF